MKPLPPISIYTEFVMGLLTRGTEQPLTPQYVRNLTSYCLNAFPERLQQFKTRFNISTA